MAQMHHAKVTEVLGQIAPGSACSVTVQHRIDKQSVVSSLGSWLACTARQQVLNAAPLIISDGVSIGHANQYKFSPPTFSTLGELIDDTP